MLASDAYNKNQFWVLIGSSNNNYIITQINYRVDQTYYIDASRRYSKELSAKKIYSILTYLLIY